MAATRPSRRQIELADGLVDSYLAAGILDANDRHRERTTRPAPPARPPVYGWSQSAGRIAVVG